MTDRLDEIQERLDAATPGPWTIPNYSGMDKWVEIPEPAVRVDYDDVNHNEQGGNIQFIAHAPDDIRYLKAIVDNLPKYADTGGPIVPGGQVFVRLPHIDGHPALCAFVLMVGAGGIEAKVLIKPDLYPTCEVNAADCYSTCSAAQAAAKEATK